MMQNRRNELLTQYQENEHRIALLYGIGGVTVRQILTLHRQNEIAFKNDIERLED